MLPDVVNGPGNVIALVNGLLLGYMAEHLDSEPAIQIIDDALLPWPAHDLGREAACRAGLAHDMVGDLISPADELVAGHDLVDKTVVEGLLRGERLTCQ